MTNLKKQGAAKTVTDAARINILPPALADRIAAGEVVERPASVVKELVENSLDSKATHITVEVKEGGISEICVSDNGQGVEREDLELAVCRHATSKVHKSSDLNAIYTLGFRGEALPSIAAVSRLTIASRVKDSDEGWALSVQGGRVGQISPAGIAQGTRVVMKDLFYNTPVRKKFLKTPNTENGHITENVTRLALSRLDCHFTFLKDGRDVFDLPAGMTAKERAGRMLKTPGGDKLVSVGGEFDGIKVSGLISPPNINMGSARALYTYLNHRFIRDRVVTRAVQDAYKGMLPKGRYPIVVLFIDIDPSRVDINVHPQKYEVRFEPGVQIMRAVIRTLADGLIKSHISEERRVPSRVVSVMPASNNAEAAPETADGFAQNRRAIIAGAIEKHIDGDRGEVRKLNRAPMQTPAPREQESRKPDGGGATHPATQPINKNAGFFSSLDVIGQALVTYIICEDEDGLVIIDQHAAHERITYTKLSEAFAGRDVLRQRLLIPERIPLMHEEARSLSTHTHLFEKLGFDIKLEGESTALVAEAPQLLAGENLAPIVKDMLFDLGDTESEEALEQAVRATLSRIACHTSVRAGKVLSRPEIFALLRTLDETELSGFCPHGRPVYFRLSKKEIEKRFART